MKLVVIAIAASLALGACSKNDSYANGGHRRSQVNTAHAEIGDDVEHCTSDVISSRNKLAKALHTLAIDQNEEAAKDAIKSCRLFSRTMGTDAGCGAEDVTHGGNTEISYSGDIQTTCEEMIKVGPEGTAQAVKEKFSQPAGTPAGASL